MSGSRRLEVRCFGCGKSLKFYTGRWEYEPGAKQGWCLACRKKRDRRWRRRILYRGVRCNTVSKRP
jgi:hypothetical protein